MRLFEAESNTSNPNPPGGWRWPAAVGIWNGVLFAGIAAVVGRGLLARQPAESHTVLLIGLGMFATSLVARALATQASARPETRLLDGLSAVLPLPFVLSQSGSSAESVAWMLVAVIAAMAGRSSEDRPSGPEREDPSDDFEEVTYEHLLLVTGDSRHDEPPLDGELDDSDGEILDGWSRRRSPEGDSITGHSVVTFGSGERIVAVHIPFLPPFDRPPEIDVEVGTTDGTEASAKVTLLRTYGVRLEVRRSGGLKAEGSCRVEWMARRAPATKAA